jgi:hypothetical protein
MNSNGLFSNLITTHVKESQHKSEEETPKTEETTLEKPSTKVKKIPRIFSKF